MMTARAFRLMAVCGCVLVLGGLPAVSGADEQSEQALKEQMRQMQQQMQELKKEVEELKRAQQVAGQQAPAAPGQATPNVAAVPPAPTGPAANATASTGAAGAKPPSREPVFEKFLKGFYGTLDVSFDDTTKGINGLTAYGYSLVDPTNPNSGYVQGPAKGVQQVGRLGYMPAFSTNKSQIGYRNTHPIAGSNVDFIVQVETALALTSAPGLRTYYTQQSNVVTGAIGLGDTFVGVQNSQWGKLRIGTTYSPYKKSTDAMNPFAGMLGRQSQQRRYRLEQSHLWLSPVNQQPAAGLQYLQYLRGGIPRLRDCRIARLSRRYR